MTFDGPVTGGPEVHNIQYVLLPNPNVVFCVPFTRMPFSDMVTTVSFANGEPIAYSQDVPSPILGFASIPKDILQSILPIPAAATTGQGVAK